MEIPISLQSHPELRRRFQQPRETQGGIGGDGALAQDDLVQTVERDAESASGVNLADAERLQKLLQ
jgi:hypothetical protein